MFREWEFRFEPLATIKKILGPLCCGTIAVDYLLIGLLQGDSAETGEKGSQFEFDDVTAKCKFLTGNFLILNDLFYGRNMF